MHISVQLHVLDYTRSANRLMICFFGTLRLVAATPEIHNLTTSFNITPTFSSSLFAYNVTTEDGYFTFKMDFDEALTCYVYEDDVFI